MLKTKRSKKNPINDTKPEATSKLWHILYLSQKHLLLKILASLVLSFSYAFSPQKNA